MNIREFYYVPIIGRLRKRLLSSEKIQQIAGYFLFLQFAIRKLPGSSQRINFLLLRIAAIGELHITAGGRAPCLSRF